MCEEDVVVMKQLHEFYRDVVSAVTPGPVSNAMPMGI